MSVQIVQTFDDEKSCRLNFIAGTEEDRLFTFVSVGKVTERSVVRDYMPPAPRKRSAHAELQGVCRKHLAKSVSSLDYSRSGTVVENAKGRTVEIIDSES